MPLFAPNAIGVNSYSASLRGPSDKTIGNGDHRGTLPYWNIHEWEMQ